MLLLVTTFRTHIEKPPRVAHASRPSPGSRAGGLNIRHRCYSETRSPGRQKPPSLRTGLNCVCCFMCNNCRSTLFGVVISTGSFWETADECCAMWAVPAGAVGFRNRRARGGAAAQFRDRVHRRSGVRRPGVLRVEGDSLAASRSAREGRGAVYQFLCAGRLWSVAFGAVDRALPELQPGLEHAGRRDYDRQLLKLAHAFKPPKKLGPTSIRPRKRKKTRPEP